MQLAGVYSGARDPISPGACKPGIERPVMVCVSSRLRGRKIFPFFPMHCCAAQERTGKKKAPAIQIIAIKEIFFKEKSPAFYGMLVARFEEPSQDKNSGLAP
jgi:hypothetical protein